MYYLVLYILGQGSAMAIIPEKYHSEEACHAAAKKDGWEHRCIEAPDNSVHLKDYLITPSCINNVTGLACK